MRVSLLVALGAVLLAVPTTGQSTDADAALVWTTTRAAEPARATAMESVRVDAAPLTFEHG